jgi:hypothetical protein
VTGTAAYLIGARKATEVNVASKNYEREAKVTGAAAPAKEVCRCNAGVSQWVCGNAERIRACEATALVARGTAIARVFEDFTR